MTPELALRKARKFYHQLLNIPARTEREQEELVWWEKRVGKLEAEVAERNRTK